MDLVSTSFRLYLAETLRPMLEFRDIVRVAGENPSGELQGSPIVLDMKDRKRRVVIEFRALTLIQEGASSLDESVASALDIVDRLNYASTIPSIQKTRCESIFIEPYALPFHELVTVMKDEYLRSTPLVDYATDIGLVFDQYEGDIVKHINIGPMEAEQLRSQFMIWPRDDLPRHFAFASLGYQQNKEVSYQRAWLQEFLGAAVNWQTEQSEVLFDFLRKGGG